MGKTRGENTRQCSWQSSGRAHQPAYEPSALVWTLFPNLRLERRELQKSAPEPYGGPWGEVHGALPSNITVIQQGPIGAAEILDTPSLPIKPNQGMSPGHGHIWPQIDIQRRRLFPGASY